MTKQETTTVYLSFAPGDKLSAHTHDFSDTAGLSCHDSQGNYVGLTFSPEHIPALEMLIQQLCALRGDFDHQIEVAEAEAEAKRDYEQLAA
jgi:hypothetical protein